MNQICYEILVDSNRQKTLKMDELKCFLCISEFNEVKKIIDHLKKEHGIKEKVHILKCIVGNAACSKTFQTWSGLKKHIQTCIHKRGINENIPIGMVQDSIVETYMPPNLRDEADVPMCHNIPIMFTNSPDINIEHTTEDADETLELEFHARMTKSVQRFADSIEKLEVTRNVKNSIYIYIKDFLAETHVYNTNLFKSKTEPDEHIYEVLEFAHKSVLNEVEKYDTVHKRNKVMGKNQLFVEPEVKAIGTHWETKKDSKVQIMYPVHAQSSFQYVPITKTLKSLFLRQEFKQLYFDYNNVSTGSRHKCVDGIFKDFCCGRIYKKNDLFGYDPESIQIQLFTDGFEMCDALKSKANRHSQVSFYFGIRNLPPELAFSLKNIHLVALCNADDLKSEQTDYNNIWKVIVDDISHLETTGIEIGDRKSLKGELPNNGHHYT